MDLAAPLRSSDSYDPQDPLAPLAVRSRATSKPTDPLALGALAKVYLIWLGGGSCEGCSVAVTGATHPRLEQLLAGAIPGLPRVELVHCLLSTESGAAWTANLLMAERGQFDAPYILTWEGSVLDESTAGEGSWSGLGQEPLTGRQITTTEWLDRLAPGAAAVIAVGTCAAWGGSPPPPATPPARAGSPTTWVRATGRPPGCPWSRSPAAPPSATTTQKRWPPSCST